MSIERSELSLQTQFNGLTTCQYLMLLIHVGPSRTLYPAKGCSFAITSDVGKLNIFSIFLNIFCWLYFLGNVLMGNNAYSTQLSNIDCTFDRISNWFFA
jgi:hypothetical protein